MQTKLPRGKRRSAGKRGGRAHYDVTDALRTSVNESVCDVDARVKRTSHMRLNAPLDHPTCRLQNGNYRYAPDPTVLNSVSIQAP